MSNIFTNFRLLRNSFYQIKYLFLAFIFTYILRKGHLVKAYITKFLRWNIPYLILCISLISNLDIKIFFSSNLTMVYSIKIKIDSVVISYIYYYIIY